MALKLVANLFDYMVRYDMTVVYSLSHIQVSEDGGNTLLVPFPHILHYIHLYTFVNVL
jgi:hypothetical protein